MDHEFLSQALAFLQQATEAAGAAAQTAAEASANAPEVTAPVAEAAAAQVTEAADEAKAVAQATAASGQTSADEVTKTAETAAAAVKETGTLDAGKAVDKESGAEDKRQKAIQAIGGITIFFITLGLFALFCAYFAIEHVIRKRLVGTALTVGVAAFAMFFWKNFPPPLGIDLQGGVEFVLQIQAEEGRVVDEQARQNVIATLEKRINETGTKTPVFSPQGADRILLQMPAATEEEIEILTRILEETARVQMSLVHPQSSQLTSRALEGEIVPGWKIAEPYDKDSRKAEHILVEQIASIEGKHVKNAGVFYQQGEWKISVQMKPDGADKMFNLTKNHEGERMAILVDGKNLLAPSINGVFSNQFEITGDFEREEAKLIDTMLNNPLQNPIKIEQMSEVSPEMGAETVRQGLYAGIAGLAITLVFMLAYYKSAGIVATIGLAINVLIIFGIMSMFQFTLTMPGIAGVILTIGIAIDANVLIYERLREEQKAGKSFKAALDAAYSKAFSAIFDANITTLIAAAILFWLATGTLKGFAITLMIGVFGSLFAALLVTKVCFGWLMDAGILKNISLWSIIEKRKQLDFLGKRRTALYISIALGILALGTLGMKKEQALGVGLRGGDRLTIKTKEDLSVSKIQSSLATLNSLTTTPQVQEQTTMGTDDIHFTVRVEEEMGKAARDHLRSDLNMALPDTQIESVGSQVGSEMLKWSLAALGLGIVGIMFYVTFRFESMAFALGAVAAVVHDLVITLGIVVLCGTEISLVMVGALLTIAGYSINDTIVVFDRLREGLKTKRGDVKDVMNFCLNATLARTILTSMTTMIVVVTLFLFGGPALKEFSLTLIIGVVIGTYSSIFIASPIVLWWARTRKLNLRKEVLDQEAAKIEGPAAAGA